MSARVNIKTEEPVPKSRRRKSESRFVERIALFLAASIALGQIQAVISVVIRQATGLLPAPGDLSVKVLESLPGWVLAVEQTREIAGYVLVCCIALLAGRNARERIAALFIVSGVMFLTKYIGLYMMIGWPQELTAFDIITYVYKPVQWQVWHILLLGLSLTGIGGWLLRRQ